MVDFSELIKGAGRGGVHGRVDPGFRNNQQKVSAHSWPFVVKLQIFKTTVAYVIPSSAGSNIQLAVNKPALTLPSEPSLISGTLICTSHNLKYFDHLDTLDSSVSNPQTPHFLFTHIYSVPPFHNGHPQPPLNSKSFNWGDSYSNCRLPINLPSQLMHISTTTLFPRINSRNMSLLRINWQ